MSGGGAVRELPPLVASAEVMAMARENCAAALTQSGEVAEAENFAKGLRDGAWRMRHEITRLLSERVSL